MKTSGQPTTWRPLPITNRSLEVFSYELVQNTLHDPLQGLLLVVQREGLSAAPKFFPVLFPGGSSVRALPN